MFRNVVRCISLVRVDKVQEELLAYAGSSFFAFTRQLLCTRLRVCCVQLALMKVGAFLQLRRGTFHHPRRRYPWRRQLHPPAPVSKSHNPSSAHRYEKKLWKCTFFSRNTNAARTR